MKKIWEAHPSLAALFVVKSISRMTCRLELRNRFPATVGNGLLGLPFVRDRSSSERRLYLPTPRGFQDSAI